MSSSTTASGRTSTTLPSWTDLSDQIGATPVGQALNHEVKIRLEGKGSAHVQNKLRKFDSDEEPPIILYRDHAGWYE